MGLLERFRLFRFYQLLNVIKKKQSRIGDACDRGIVGRWWAINDVCPLLSNNAQTLIILHVVT